jgi:hypothetical protein
MQLYPTDKLQQQIEKRLLTREAQRARDILKIAAMEGARWELERRLQTLETWLKLAPKGDPNRRQLSTNRRQLCIEVRKQLWANAKARGMDVLQIAQSKHD